jgi:hypothetical protein
VVDQRGSACDHPSVLAGLPASCAGRFSACNRAAPGEVCVLKERTHDSPKRVDEGIPFSANRGKARIVNAQRTFSIKTIGLIKQNPFINRKFPLYFFEVTASS